MRANIDAWVALVAAVFGGAGLKIIESFLTKRQRDTDINKSLRDELRAEIASLRERIEQLEKDVSTAQADADTWREKYYKAIEVRYDQMKKELENRGK